MQLSRMKLAEVQWSYLTELYYVHSSCHFTTFQNLHYFCDMSFQATKNHLMKTKWAGVDLIDRRVGKNQVLQITFHLKS